MIDLMPVNLNKMGEINRCLTHQPLDKMPAISQAIFSDAFSGIKNLYFDLNFIEICS